MTAGLQISVKFARSILHELTVQAESIIFAFVLYANPLILKLYIGVWGKFAVKTFQKPIN